MVQACLGGGPGLKIQGENTPYGGENQHRVREELTGRKTLGRSVLPRSQGEVARVYMCVCVRERERDGFVDHCKHWNVASIKLGSLQPRLSVCLLEGYICRVKMLA